LVAWGACLGACKREKRRISLSNVLLPDTQLIDSELILRRDPSLRYRSSVSPIWAICQSHSVALSWLCCERLTDGRCALDIPDRHFFP
jgi:hypothetical protein